MPKRACLAASLKLERMAKFRLQEHEVWRERLVREGEYAQSRNFGDVGEEWNSQRFACGSYHPLRAAEGSVGYALFRPENAPETENFFAPDKLNIPHIAPEDHGFFCPREGAWSAHDSLDGAVESALSQSVFGRVFYLEGDELRRDGTMRPCNWGVFICSTGHGLWKWTMRDGVTWNKTSSDGLFRWHNNPTKAARFLARTPSTQVWAHLQWQLEHPDSEIAFSRRWLQLGEEEQFDSLAVWTNGSRDECSWVLRALALCDEELAGARSATITWSMLGEDDSVWLHDEDEWVFSSRLQRAFAALREYFGVRPMWVDSPLCCETSDIEWQVLADIENPTAHERLEAHQQLETWAKERGLSFDSM